MSGAGACNRLIPSPPHTSYPECSQGYWRVGGGRNASERLQFRKAQVRQLRRQAKLPDFVGASGYADEQAVGAAKPSQEDTALWHASWHISLLEPGGKAEADDWLCNDAPRYYPILPDANAQDWLQPPGAPASSDGQNVCGNPVWLDSRCCAYLSRLNRLTALVSRICFRVS